MKRLFAWFLCICLLLTAIACKGDPQVEEVVPTAEPTAVPTAEPTATPEPPPTASELWAEFDRAFMEMYLLSDPTTFHQLVADAEAMGLDASQVPATIEWGDEEDEAETYERYHALYDQMLAIPYEELTEREQFAFDTLKQWFEHIFEKEEYDYYYEPLVAYVGEQVNIPLVLWMYFIREEKDIEPYLTILEGMPAYLAEMLTYEQKRAELGLFMTETALDNVQEDLKDIYDAGEDLFLYETFATQLVELGMTEEQMAPYIERNNAGLLALMESYRTLSEGLEALRESCSEAKSMTGTEREFFEICVREESGRDLSPNAALQLLEAQLLMTYSMLYTTQESMTSYEEQMLSLGSTDDNLNYLEETVEDILPALPEVEIDFYEVPETLADMFSPAAYLHPAVDNWQHNTILMNLDEDDTNVLPTLAHEVYPGHMYQYVYHHAMEDLPKSQILAENTAYAEAWSQHAEFLLATEGAALDRIYMLYEHALSSYTTMIATYISIKVNYYNMDRKGVVSTCEWYGLTKDFADYAYEMAIDNPYYYMPYAFGYANLMEFYYKVYEETEDEDSIKAFYEFYLDLGPSYFNLIEKKLDDFLQELTAE